MPRKSRKKDTTEPTPVADVLAQSPIAEIIASGEAEQPDSVATFQKQREREQAVNEPPGPLESLVTEALVESQKPTHAARLKGLRPAPSGFVGLEGHYAAGIRLNRSLDKQTVAIQFADDQRPSRDGLNTETQRLGDRGFSYMPERAQWERRDREQPGENYQDAKQFVASLVKSREEAAGVQR